MGKLQILRNEVERLKSQLLRGACSSQIAMETMCKEEVYNEVLAILDTIQEESISEKLKEVATQYGTEEFPKLCCGCKHIPCDAFIDGYRQAEEDSELTWKDLATIEKLGDDFFKQNHTPMSDEEFYKEVLKRFKDYKERKKI